MKSSQPLVSVIIATYNRSDVLAYAISSVIHSTYRNWELYVVGDACTDDTDQVVAAFKHERIRYLNLAENFGDQGGPNNEGFKHAKGEYIAYLSHDDLWLPNHLESAIKHFETTGADMVTTLGIRAVNPEDRSLVGAMPGNDFFPFTGIPASLWVCKRALIEEVGPWCHPGECRLAPSQHLLLKAWKKGKKIQALPEVTVMVIPAGERKGVYTRGGGDENRRYFQKIAQDPNFVEKELIRVARGQLFKSGKLPVLSPLQRGLLNALKRMVYTFGMPPMKLAYLKYYRKKGSYINRWRKTCGLDSIKE